MSEPSPALNFATVLPLRLREYPLVCVRSGFQREI